MAKRIMVLAAGLVCIALWGAYSHAQPTDAPIDVSGEWVGVIAWTYDEGSSAPGDVFVYRLNITQDSTTLLATHLTDGDDLLVTQPIDRYAQQADGYGFEGSITGDSIEFSAVGIFMGHCTITIHLHYGDIDGDAVLVGEWSRDIIPIPTPWWTPSPDDRAPDVVVGCGSPTSGAIVLRRFDTSGD